MAQCCVPPPALAGCAATAGVKSGPQDGKPNTGRQEPCPCCASCAPKPSVVKPCYKQPRIPESYAPRRTYIPPESPLDTHTTYKLSYLPTENCKNLRGEVRKPMSNLVASCEPMESCTVQKLSYLPNSVLPTQAIRPCNHNMWGQGPMQQITTQRHDFVPKPAVCRQSFKPPPKLHSVEEPFDNRTINRLSFLNPGPCRVPESYAPLKAYEKPTAPMELETTQKMSYQRVCAPQPQRPPWACKMQYQKPGQRIEGTTIYQASFLPPGEDCTEQQQPQIQQQVVSPSFYGDCKACHCKCQSASQPCHFPKAAA